MKKLISLLLAGLVCAGSLSAETAVVYFSCTGNTRQLAKTASKALDADLFEIIPEQAYTSADLNWNDRQSRSTKECNDPKARPKIKAVKPALGDGNFDVSRYDTIILAFPIWWYNAPKIIYTFAESFDLSGKKIVPLCTSGGSGLGSTGADLAKASGKGDWRRGKRFYSNAGEAEIKAFVEASLK